MQHDDLTGSSNNNVQSKISLKRRQGDGIIVFPRQHDNRIIE